MASDEEMFQPSLVSDTEIHFFDNLQLNELSQVTNDIQKSFGRFNIASYTDLTSDFEE